MTKNEAVAVCLRVVLLPLLRPHCVKTVWDTINFNINNNKNNINNSNNNKKNNNSNDNDNSDRLLREINTQTSTRKMVSTVAKIRVKVMACLHERY